LTKITKVPNDLGQQNYLSAGKKAEGRENTEKDPKSLHVGEAQENKRGEQ
jgi:hypothetical protein